MTQPHPNFTTGEPCYCGWGRNDLKSKIASSFEELQGMKRYKGSDAQGVLNYLQQRGFINDQTGKWIPWLMNEIKKGGISVGWEAECPACEGEGTQPCEECEGIGRVDCPECASSDADGYDDDGNECDHCNGNGDLDCGYCSQGDDDCIRCDGEGSIAGYDLDKSRKKGELQTPWGSLVYDPTNKDNSKYVNETHNRVKELYVGSDPFVQFPNNDVGNGSGTLDSATWQHWCDWLNGGSASRQQFNPTNDGVKDLEQGVTAWDQKMKEDAESANRDEVRAAGTVLHTDPDGWNIRSLSPEELKAEGDSMGHCVGSYVDEVHDGDLQVLSLRDPNGDPHVTTGIEYDQIRNEELGQPREQQKGTIGQHYGKGNQEPKPEYNERLRNYFQTLPEEVRPYSGGFHKPIDHIEDLKKHLGLVNGEREVDDLGLQHEPAIRYDHIMDSLVNKGLDAYGNIWEENTDNPAAPENSYDPENGKIFYDFCQQPANPYSDIGSEHPAEDLKHSILRWQDWSNGNTPDNARVQMTNHLTDMYNNDPRNAMDSIPFYNPETKIYEYGKVNDPRLSSASDWDYGTHPHFYDGKPCSCPWGEVDNHKTAAKIDMLMKRKDLQTPEAQELLNTLVKAKWPDKMLPWTIREWKKGRLQLAFPEASYFTIPERDDQTLNSANAQEIVNVSDGLARYKNHPQNEFGGGINFDQHTVGDLIPYVKKAEQWLDNVDRSKGGDTVHQFEGSHVNPRLMPTVECPECKGDGNGSVTDECQECDGKGTIQSRRPEDANTVNTEGWTVKRLATPEDCVREGKDMHHCVGQDQYAQGVSKDPDKSSHHLFSLRDHENYPHATIQLGKPSGSEGQYVNQIQGEWDKPGHPDHLDMVNDWLDASHPGQGVQGHWEDDEEEYENQCPECGEDEDYCECNRFQGPVNAQGIATGGQHISTGEWWDDQYPTEQAASVEDYLNQPRFSPYEVEHSSDPNWDRAMGDYNTHHENAHRQYGVHLEPPSLYYPEPDFDSIWDELANPIEHGGFQDTQFGKPPLFRGYGDEMGLASGYHHREFDPKLHQSVANSAADQYHMRKIKEKYDDWLEDDYEGDKYPHERQMKDFWDKEFAKHINPSTGEWEDPIPWSSVRRTERPSHLPNYRDLKGHSRDSINSEGEAIGGETAVDRWWKDNSHNYPQIPYQPNAEGVGYEGLEADLPSSSEWSKGDHQMPDWNPWREDTDKAPNEFTDVTVPPKPSYWSKIAHRTHPHIFYGHPCTCPWGHDMEFHGSVKTAARIDKLRGEKGPAYLKTPEGEKLLKVLEDYDYPDVLIPWICREWSKGNIMHDGALRVHPQIKDGEYISPARAEEIANTVNEMKKIPANKGGGGIDLMQYDAQGLHDKINQSMKFLEERDRPNRGEVVHRFDEPNEGWTVRKIRNKNEAQIEGRMDQMNNCVRGYGDDIESGDAHMFSLRDPDNQPHVSLQLNNADLDADNSVYEIKGKNNDPVEPEHLGMVNEFLGKHGIKEAQSQEPWWEEAYYRHPAEDAVSYAHLTEEGYDDYNHEAPDEWYDAYNAAEEMGLEPPELYDSPPNINAVWNDMTKSKNWGREDKDWEKEKEVHNQVIENAKNRGELEEFYNQHKDWSQDSSNLETPYSRQMNDHWQQEMKQHIDPNDGEFEAPTWTTPSSRMPEARWGWNTVRDKWWNQNKDDYPQIPGYDWQPRDPDGVQRQQPPIPSFIASAPLYYRWVFSPESGEVELSHNQEGHPAEIPYHEQLADKINRANVVNGYAYRIGNGWRLSDDEHKPVEDPYVVSQVMRALGMTNERRSAEWTADEDYDRLHYGLPVIKD